ncbi:MAG: hypothetical protein GY750_16835 [Lentisphaerae bacterium]|nr:hypothetical protein [Lentisphaerota bacterium]MCP4103063.1 hypothetical protein [Lentisphaerota bacterium]
MCLELWFASWFVGASFKFKFSYKFLLFFSVVTFIIVAVGIFIFPWLLRICGKAFDGKAKKKEVRPAFLWACLPLIILIPVFLLLLLVQTDNFTTPVMVSFLLTGFLATQLWAFILLLKTLSQVQGFSLWKAFQNLFLTFSLVVYCIAIPIGIIVLIVNAL